MDVTCETEIVRTKKRSVSHVGLDEIPQSIRTVKAGRALELHIFTVHVTVAPVIHPVSIRSRTRDRGELSSLDLRSKCRRAKTSSSVAHRHIG